MLGRLKITIEECIEIYTFLLDKVFKKQKHRVTINGKPREIGQRRSGAGRRVDFGAKKVLGRERGEAAGFVEACV